MPRRRHADDRDANNVELDEPTTRRRRRFRPGDYVQLTMRDTGVGMDAQTLARVFEPFFTTKPQGPARASVSRRSTESSNSRSATFRRRAPPARDRFTILLPSRATRPSRPDARRTPLDAGTRRSPHERTCCSSRTTTACANSLARCCRARGYHVHSARNGVDALDQMHILDLAIDVVVTDVVMPEMGGRELVEHLRRRRPTSPFSTSRATPTTRECSASCTRLTHGYSRSHSRRAHWPVSWKS